MTQKKYRVHEALKYNYSDIGEYVDENHTDRPLMNDEIVDLLNEQEELLNQIKKLCMNNRIPVCLGAHIPKNCEHYHDCFENHTENAVSFGESKIANKILKIIKGDDVE